MVLDYCVRKLAIVDTLYSLRDDVCKHLFAQSQRHRVILNLVGSKAIVAGDHGIVTIYK